MEAAILLPILILGAIIGFFILKKADVFLEEGQNRENDAVKSGENVIKIACENPVMLPFITEKIDRQKREFSKISFYLFTGCREDIEKTLESGSCDLILLMGEAKAEEYKGFHKEVGYFIPSYVYEPLTELKIEPVEKNRMIMSVLWNEKNITETKRRLISVITAG